jgi:uncharacterized protein YaaN involved in tellurite resistance
MSQKETLQTSKISDIKEDLKLGDPTNIQVAKSEQGQVETQAEQYVEKILDFEFNNHDLKESNKASVENYGIELQKISANQSEMLKRPLHVLSSRAEDGGEVSKGLVDLKVTVEDLDPASFDFNAGWITRTLGFLPFIGNPIKRYFSKFENAETVINAIILSLEKGRDQLKRDNITLSEDQKRMREINLRLEKAINIGQMMDQKIAYQLERELANIPDKKRFVEEEILFPLRQRLLDLQQQVAVNQQGAIASEIIIRNNKELARGVNRALHVTVTALEVAVTTALALADQKIVLEKVNALNSTTDKLIASNAKRLKEQGAEIHKQAASTSINIETLTQAFDDIKSALDDISQFKREALPQMASSILEMDNLITEAEKSIKDIDKTNSAQAHIEFDF